MNILLIDDQPEIKCFHLLEYLKNKNLSFDYKIFKSVNPALRYIAYNINEIDLVVLELGLPLFDDNYNLYDKFYGLRIID